MLLFCCVFILFERAEFETCPLHFDMIGKFQCVQPDGVDQYAQESERDIEQVAENSNEDHQDRTDDFQSLRHGIHELHAHSVEFFGDERTCESDGKQTDIGKNVHETADQ